MADRITKKDIERELANLNSVHNDITGRKDDMYGLDIAYGGYRLVRKTDTGGMANVSLRRLTAREAYEQIMMMVEALGYSLIMADTE